MKNTSLFILLLITFFYCCKKETFSDMNGASISFSMDTIIFDTTFHSIGTPYKILKVYNQNEFDIGFDSLTAAMNEELTSESSDNVEQDLDELLQFLHEEADEIIPPKAYAGENQIISVSDSNAVVVTLDGSQSSDPQDRITTWSWLDSTGREISTEAKLRVKLSPGIHRFELRVFDVDGGMTTDSVQITVEYSGS